MFTLHIIRESEDITMEINDFDISKQATDPSNIEAGRFIARTYEYSNPVDLFYLTDLTDVTNIEVLKDNEVIFTTDNFIVPREVRGYYEMAALAMATEIHFSTAQE